MHRRVLILGGTTEARHLANCLVTGFDDRLDIETSLAGRTSSPRLPAGRVRTGGFGGAEALAAYLRSERIEFLIDATHPYAASISRNAAKAAEAAGVRRLTLTRPSWRQQPGDRWYMVRDEAAAVALLPTLGACAFLTLGARALPLFAELTEMRLVARMVTAPSAVPDHPDLTILADRGPFDLAGERALFSRHAIDILVSKNSGGSETSAKLLAARAVGIPVVMVERPPFVPGDVVESVDAAIGWLSEQLDGA